MADKRKKGQKPPPASEPSTVILGMGTIIPGRDGPRFITYTPPSNDSFPDFGPGLRPEISNDPFFADFARTACSYIMPGYPQDHERTIKMGYRMKEDGNKFFREAKYELACTNYRYSAQLFQYVVKVFPYAATEVLLVNSNLSVAHYKLKEYKKALEYANVCIELDHHFIKGYFRRAEASHALAEDTKGQGQDAYNLFFDALKDYCKCYRKMTSEKDKQNRVKQFVEALIISIELNTTKFLPDFHESDRDSICSSVIILLISNYTSEKIEKALNFLFFPNPSVEKSGLAVRYHCDVSSLSVSLVFTKRVLTEPILDMLVQCNLLVRSSDLAAIVGDLKPKRDFPLFERLVSICRAQSNDICRLSEVLDKALIAKNNPFAVHLLTVENVTPTLVSSGAAFQILLNGPETVFRKISSLCTPEVRSDFAAKAVAVSNIVYFDIALTSGILKSARIDVSLIVGVGILNTHRRFLTAFLTTGASPDGVVGSPAPLTAVFRGNSLTRETQVHIVIILIRAGASIKHLSSAFSDPMSPLHVATKLVMETGIMEVLELVSVKFDFPTNGRIVDKHNRTPLHLVMLSEPSLLSIQVLEYLVTLNIDKTIKDDQGKRAEDYALSHQDRKRKALVAISSSSSSSSSTTATTATTSNSNKELTIEAKLSDRAIRNTLRRELMKEAHEIEELGQDLEDEETLKKWEMKFERTPKLMRMALAKKGGSWNCDMSLYPLGTTFEEALRVARAQKEEGNALFGDKKYSEALTTYGQSHMKFDWICANYPRKIPKIKDDIKILSCNMALGYHRSGVPEASVECCNDAIDIDPAYVKAYYRRAEAFKYIAQHRNHPNKPNYSHECFCNAVKDYSRAYSFSTGPSDVNKRSEWYFECLIISVDVGHTENLPSIHESDKPVLLTKVIEHLAKHDTSYYTKELEVYLDFILLKTNRLPNVGLAHTYPCSCASVSLVSLLPNVQSELLRALLSRGCVVLSDDIVESVRVLKKSQLPIMKQLLESFTKDLDKNDVSSLTAICNEIMNTKKLHFISLLVKYGATPNPESILEYADFSKLDSILTKYVAASCSPSARTKLFCCILQTGTTKEAVEVTLHSGPLLIEDIELTSIITSSLLVHHTEILSDLYAITPQSSLPLSSASPSLTIVFSSKFPSRLQQAQLAETLIRFGADIYLLSSAYSESLGPLHVATKLALETGHIELIPVVCSKFVFDGQSKLIDKNTQTPLHYVMRAKHNDRTVKICEHLCDYPINPLIKDRWGKTAQDYGRAKGDKRLPFLQKVGHLTGHKIHVNANSIETPPIPVAVVTEPVTPTPTSASSNQPPSPPPPEVHKPEPSQKNKKKKKKGGKGGGGKGGTTSPLLASSQEERGEEDKDINNIESELVNKQRSNNSKILLPIVKKLSPSSTVTCPDLHTLLSQLESKETSYFISISNNNITVTNTTSNPLLNDVTDKTLTLSTPLPKTTYLINFDDQPWEIECTDNFISFLKDTHFTEQVKRHVLHKLCTLATGGWNKGDDLSRVIVPEQDRGPNGVCLYEVLLSDKSSLIWEIVVQFSPRCSTSKSLLVSTNSTHHMYSEVIRIWDIIYDSKDKMSCIEKIQKSHERGLQSHLRLPLVPHSHSGRSSSKNLLPRHYSLQSTDNPCHADGPIVTYVPAGRTKDDEFNVITFYSLTSSLAKCALIGTHPRRDFPFKEWPKEHDIIYTPPNKEAILLLGRSGTGKTTCCLYRLWNQFNEYWEQRFVSGGPCYPRRPLPLLGLSQVELKELVVAEDVTSVVEGRREYEEEEVGNEDEIEREDYVSDLHQVFLTKNYVLCSQMKKRFYDLAASHDCYSDHMIHENDPTPVSMTTIDDFSFPLFLTSRQFLILLDGSLGGETFFPRNRDGTLAIRISSSDYDHEDPNTQLLNDLEVSDEEEESPDDENDHAHIGVAKQQIWREVTSYYFVSEIWPKICHHCSDKSIDPLLVWIEIKSFIKGSILAVGKPTGALTPWEYEAIGRKMATNFTCNRSEVYSLYEHYKNYVQRKRNLNLFDENDLVSNLYRRLTSCRGNGELPWSIHHFFVDEVQDFTQAELGLLLRLSQEPNGLFLTGDTAQSIMKGISFRFRDLRSLFHLANTQSIKSPSPLRIPVPRLQELVVNFRSHSGILHLASSVIELMREYFPSSFDRLPEDRGMFPGPLPVFLQSCQVSDLALLLRTNKRVSSCIEFGAHQVIIVQNEDSKSTLPEVLKSGIVLTIFEAKGLEFDDVLLYNFFTDSLVNKEWRVVTTFADKIGPPSEEKPKPRPLNFNERFHKSLNCELKYLYTAITRAKCNLWIYDSSEPRRLPMLDYWSRRGLIRVIRVQEQEYDGDKDSVLFTTTSTSSQWTSQGDYFLRKGLWEVAMKCYRKAGNTFAEKEAEGYMCAQRAKQGGRTQKEVQELFERASHSFLSCDYLRHDVKLIDNAAKCLKNAGKYKEAGKLFESLQQYESAKKCYYRSKDYHSLSRLRETEGEYSEAIRIFVRVNKRMEALETAKRYETQHFQLEPDVSSLQLANTYAKYFISHQEEGPLIKVLEYIPNSVQRISLLKKSKLFKLALEEHIKVGHFKEAERVLFAQEMFEEGMKFARERNERGLETRFILAKVSADIFNKRKIDDNLNELLLSLTKSTSTPFGQAKALLLYGMIHSKPNLFREAIKLYTDTCISTVGALEAFNQYVLFKKKEVSYSQVIPKCFEAQELAKVFRTATGHTPSKAKCIQYVLEFYKMNKYEVIYLLCRSQDIWVKNLKSTCQEMDENEMLILDPVKVHALLVDRYNEFWTRWLAEAEVERQIISRLSSFSFHHDVVENGYLPSHIIGLQSNVLKEYIQVTEVAIKTNQLNPGKLFRGLDVEFIPLKLFSFSVSLCLPLTKMNCFQFRRSETVHPVLYKIMDSFLTSRSLWQPHVDDLFNAWFCQALIDSNRPNYLEEMLESFAKKEGYPTGHTKAWLVMDKHNKDSVVYHHFFSFWLKACRLLREGSQVIVATKLVYNCFFCVIARRPTLRKTISMINFIIPLSIFSLALIGVASVGRPSLNLCVPIFYRYQSQLFDILNIKVTKQFWMLSACVQLAETKKDDRQTFLDTKELLYQMLELSLGVYQEQFNPLKIALGNIGEVNDGAILHCLVCVLTLLGNLFILRPEKHEEMYKLLLKMESLIKETCRGGGGDPKLMTCLQTVLDKLQSANSVSDLFDIIQYLYQCYNYPTGLAKLLAAKSGNMDFKEFSTPPQHMNNVLIKPKEETPPPAPPPPPEVVKKDTPLEEPTDHTSSSSSSTTSLTATEIAPPIAPPITPAVIQPQVIPLDTQLQQQWSITMQKLEELRQYHSVIEQQLIQLRQIPQHLITQAHEQRQYFLTQQYYQIIQTQQQYKLQQETIQRQYQMSILNAQIPHPITTPTNIPHGATPTNIPHGATPTNLTGNMTINNVAMPIITNGTTPTTKEEEDDLGMSFDEEEIEKILGSFMSSDPPIEEQPIEEQRTAIRRGHISQENGDGEDDIEQLVDDQYCQVCDITFVQRNTILKELEEEEEEGSTGLFSSSFQPEHKRHLETQSHVDNLLAYKKFNSIKSGPFAVLRGKLNEVLRKGQELSTLAQVDVLLLQVVSELRSLDEQLEELVNEFKWKEAHSRIMSSLDMLQAHTTRLVRTYEIVTSRPPTGGGAMGASSSSQETERFWERDDDIGLEDIEVAAQEFKKSKKRQKKK